MNRRSEDGVWDIRAAALVAAMRSVVAWVRERQGARIEVDMLPGLLSLSSFESVLLDRTLPVPGPDGDVQPIYLDGMSEDVFTALADYMEGTPAWYGQRCGQNPRHTLVREQHLYVLLSVEPHLPALLA